MRLHERPLTSDKPPPDVEILIREARRLRRRRWAIGMAVVALAVTGSGLGVGFSGSGSGGQHRRGLPGHGEAGKAIVISSGVTMLDLSKSDKYGDIALAGGRIVLYGPAIRAQYPSASARCNSAEVDPTTLALSHLMTSSCANPAIEDQHVLPVVTVEPDVAFGTGGVATVTVRISRVVAGPPGYLLGPVVMSFPQESDGWPTWTYGGGDLWLFDALAKGGSQLVRISCSTGAVLQRIAMPAISRPIVAFDDDGFWLAPAANSGGDSGASNGVYHVTPGSAAATRAFSLPSGEPVSWLVAIGHSLWLAPGPRPSAIWHRTGASATLAGRAQLPASLADVLMVQGSGSAMVGGPSGLWTAVPKAAGTGQRVFLLLPDSGSATEVALLKPAYAAPDDLRYGKIEAVSYRRSMYLLDPPAESGPGYRSEGFSALYRITLIS